ncbi:myrosinase 1-like [Frankliniella occidentalis]|uniref:beta-glucosidase n=1 Tax=Frankliniella occidentalis TaxID=133901 RepID=A0A6J1SCW2_FRAOC|nr:myrosinase 1-like [Frankliniella occidentalis]
MTPLYLVAVLVAVCSLARGSPARGPQDDYALPDELLIGAGTAAIQTEGAWDEDGKGESMVDYLLHSGKLGPDGFSAPHLHDRGADSYHRYKDDVAMAAKLKLQVYRFSISWARVLPEADATKPNAKGVQFYHNLIDEIRAHNITPLVTMYHFDHPQILEEEFKGWLNKKMVVKFREYASFLIKEYGHKVKMWTSMNEPNLHCSFWMKEMVTAEVLRPEEVDLYSCMHNFILGHGEARKALTESGHEGTIGMSVASYISRPNSTRAEDAYASEAFNQFYAGLMLHPLVFGDYPPIVKELAKDKLPVFTEEEKAMLTDSTDYIGLNLYFGMMVSYRDPSTTRMPVIMPCAQLLDQLNFVNVGYRDPQGGTIGDYPLNMIAPDSMRSALTWVWFNYKKPVVITENGIGDKNMTGVEDHMRAVYHSVFLRSLVSSMKEFGVRVIAYCAWSLIDSFEWRPAYGRPFGLIHVDYQGGSYNRSLKESSSFWIEMADRRAVPVVDMPSSAAAATSAWLLLVAVASASALQ